MSGIVNSTGAVSGIIGKSVLPSSVKRVEPRNKGLIVEYKSATTVDIDADYLTVYDTNNHGVVLSSINLTMTVSSTGANGRSVSENSGSEAANDWYHLWVIYNGTTTACYGTLAFAEATVLSDLPSGYTHLKYVGAIYNDGSSNLEDMYQVDNEVTIDNLHGEIVSNADIGSLSSYSLAVIIPDTVTCAQVSVSIHDSNVSEYRSSLTFYLDSNLNHIVALAGVTQQSSTTYVNLRTLDTIKLSPIKNRTTYVLASSSVGEIFTLEVRTYTHNNII
jgi:hypothetical protein